MSKALLDALPYKTLSIEVNEFIKILTSKGSFGDDREIIVYVGDFPAFTDLLIIRFKSLKRTDITSAPDYFLEERGKR